MTEPLPKVAFIPHALLGISLLIPPLSHNSGVMFSSSDAGVILWLFGFVMIPVCFCVQYLALPIGAVLIGYRKFAQAAFLGFVSLPGIAFWWHVTDAHHSTGVVIHGLLMVAAALSIVGIGMWLGIRDIFK